jgi:hypothetical protein
MFIHLFFLIFGNHYALFHFNNILHHLKDCAIQARVTLSPTECLDIYVSFQSDREKSPVKNARSLSLLVQRRKYAYIIR